MNLDVVRGSLATSARVWRGRWQTLRRPHALYLACPDAGHTPADEAAAWQAPLDAFDAWCAAHPGARCELALGSAATLWHLAPKPDAASGSAAYAPPWAAWDEAFAQWAHYFDVDLQQPEALAQWQLQEAPADGFTLLAATPLVLSAGLQNVADAHGVQLLWLGPWWVRGLARWLQTLPHGTDAAKPAQPACLRLTEPGWAWVAQAQAPAAPTSLLQRRWGHSAWQLAQLAWAPQLMAQPAPAPQTVQTVQAMQAMHDVSLGLPQPASGGCHSVDLAVLRGHSPVWSPA